MLFSFCMALEPRRNHCLTWAGGIWPGRRTVVTERSVLSKVKLVHDKNTVIPGLEGVCR